MYSDGWWLFESENQSLAVEVLNGTVQSAGGWAAGSVGKPFQELLLLWTQTFPTGSFSLMIESAQAIVSHLKGLSEAELLDCLNKGD